MKKTYLLFAKVVVYGDYSLNCECFDIAFSALATLVWHREEYQACKIE